MKLMTLTDFHGMYALVPKIARVAQSEKVDAIVVAGDITNFGPVSVASQIVRGLLVVGVPVMWIPGNCDPQELVGHAKMPPHEIHFKTYTLDDKLFIGLGGTTPTPFPGMLEYAEDKYVEKVKQIMNEIHDKKDTIFVTHDPPLNTAADVVYSGEHVGSGALRDLAIAYKPKAMLCGHIHESQGADYIKKTLVVNPGPAMNGLYAIVEENDDKWSARFGTVE